MRFNAGYFRLILMVGVLVFIIIYGKRFSDNFAKSFVSFTTPPKDAGAVSTGPTSDTRFIRYNIPDGSTVVSADEMQRLLIAAVGAAPERRIIESLRLSPSDEIFVARVRALTTIVSSRPDQFRIVGLQLAAVLDDPLSPPRLRAVVDALQFLSGKSLPPRAKVWKAHWASIDAGFNAREVSK